jgi:1-acyl-sn-glycerol-3-phosphate acyltransferase
MSELRLQGGRDRLKWARKMPTFEDEQRRVAPVGRLLSRAALAGKSLVLRGGEHIVRSGPSIIVGNHCGSFKDVAALYRSVPRPLFFTANQNIFSRDSLNAMVRKHLKRHLRGFAGAAHLLASPFLSLIVDFVSSNIAKVGAIPVDLYNRDGKHEAIRRSIEYLKAGRAIVALQGRGRVMPQDPNPYVRAFSRGTSVIAYEMYDRHGVDVPVTPVAFFGTQVPLFTPGRVWVGVGPPLFVSRHLAGGMDATAARFRDALEAAVKGLLLDAVRERRRGARA